MGYRSRSAGRTDLRPGRRETGKAHRSGVRLLTLQGRKASLPYFFFFGFFSGLFLGLLCGFCDPALAYAGATANVRIAGATYAALLMKSRRPALALDVALSSMGVIPLQTVI